MYCRKCGKKLERNETKCPACGTDVIEVKQRTYEERYKEEKLKEKDRKEISKAKFPKDVKLEDNPYVNFALITSLATLVLEIIPWPKAWGIGTALWMRILILLMAFISVYHCFRALQIHKINAKSIEAYNKRHPKDKLFYEKPITITFSTAVAVVVAAIATFSLFA